MQQNRPILVIDAFSSFVRHFIKNPTMSENGDPMGGYVGFLKSVGSLCTQFNPKEVIVVWESGGNQKRRAMSGGTYKNGSRPQSLNRYYEDEIPNTKENHNHQVYLTVESLKCLPVKQLYVQDTEADDVIGYICNYKFSNDDIIIVSSDKDLYQLINERVQQWSLNQKKLIDESTVIEKFGVSPQNFCVARSFIGDTSDAIGGVKGAGFKTLAKRFPELASNNFISVSEIVIKAKELSAMSNLSLYKSLIAGEEEARKNWKLMHLDIARLNGDQVKKIEHQLGTQKPQPNKMSLLRILHKEGIRNIDIDSTYAAIKATLINE